MDLEIIFDRLCFVEEKYIKISIPVKTEIFAAESRFKTRTLLAVAIKGWSSSAQTGLEVGQVWSGSLAS